MIFLEGGRGVSKKFDYIIDICDIPLEPSYSESFGVKCDKSRNPTLQVIQHFMHKIAKY